MIPIARGATTVFVGLFVLAWLLAPSSAKADDQLAIKNLDTSMRSIIKKSCASLENTGASIVSMESGEIIYNRNGAVPFIPASTQKLVVSSAALHYLGPAYKFKTRISHTGTRMNGTVKGDLYIKGFGDPKLTPENVWTIVKTIHGMGINRVEGKLVVDQTFFDGAISAPSWDKKRSQRAYDAGLSALSVNFNTVAVRVFPGESKGRPLAVSLFPDPGYFKVVNKSVTGSGGKKVAASRISNGDSNSIIVTGKMVPGEKEETVYISVKDPVKLSGSVFFEYFKSAGVAIAEGWTTGKEPEDTILLHIHKSEPLALILRGLNKFSNNFTAEQVAKTLAAELNGAPGTHDDALKILTRFLKQSQIPFEGIHLADASGLSRENRLTTLSLAALLFKMGKRFDIGPDLMATLGIMGVDGSLKDRGAKYKIVSAARAKTGTLMGISSLAGYAAGSKGEYYSFAVIVNDSRCSYPSAARICDQVVAAIHQFGP